MSLPADHPRLRKRPFTALEVLADGIVHALALVAGMLAFAVLLSQVAGQGSAWLFVALAVYAAGFFLMFGFSAAYNMVPPSPLKWVLRRFDHASIYLMIAGTYTAVAAQFHDTAQGFALAGAVWAGALCGAGIKLALPGRYDRLAILAYIALGFVGVLAIGPARAALPGVSLWLLVLGGLTFVAGVGFYKWHALPYHNAVWHLFVLVAAALQFAGIALAAMA